MGYFPFFIDLAGRAGLVVGGGSTALRKLEKLKPYGPALTAAALAFCPEIEGMEGVTLLRRPFREEMLEGQFFAIAATDDPAVNHRVAALCRERGILVNVVDDREECTFLFPALVGRGALSVGVSTGGSSPTAAVWLKERIDGLLPQIMEEILTFLDSQRAAARRRFPGERERSGALKALFRACLDRGRPLDEGETEEIWRQEGGR